MKSCIKQFKLGSLNIIEININKRFTGDNMDLNLYLRTSLKLFVIDMENALLKNDEKGGWDKCEYEFLTTQLEKSFYAFPASVFVSCVLVNVVLYDRLAKQLAAKSSF